VFDPQTRELAKGKPRVLICDGFGTHETLETLEFCFANNIILCRLPSHSSHKLQPCDLAAFAPLKTAYRDEVERLNRGGVNNIGKQHFTYLYKPARDRALTRRNILAGWSAAGLFPYNLDRVLRGMPKPPAEVSCPNVEVAEPAPHDEAVPLTPVTPVTADALASLHDRIKQESNLSDEASKQRLQRCVDKLVSAAKISFAKQSLLQDHNRLLFKINSEAKVRRSTRPLVIGRAKVMSYEDLDKARVARAAKDKAAADKGTRKRGRKRKASAHDEEEEEEAEMEMEVESREVDTRQAGSSLPKGKTAKRKSKVQEAAPWTAPVALMYR
jgi:hypothetical protein